MSSGSVTDGVADDGGPPQQLLGGPPVRPDGQSRVATSHAVCIAPWM